MCEDCVERMGIVEERVQPAITEALKAFWNVIEAKLSEVGMEGGFMSDLDVLNVNSALTDAVTDWAMFGLNRTAPRYVQPLASISKPESFRHDTGNMARPENAK